jgi:hypothetical protein
MALLRGHSFFLGNVGPYSPRLGIPFHLEVAFVIPPGISETS